jgi:hypothetical protein
VTFLQHYATLSSSTKRSVNGRSSWQHCLSDALASWRDVPDPARLAGHSVVIVFRLYFAVFAWANPLVFRWYLAPPMPMYFLCILAGLWGPAHQMIGKRGIWIVAAAGAGWVALSLAAWTLHPDHGPDRPAPEMAWFELELLYQEATRSDPDE